MGDIPPYSSPDIPITLRDELIVGMHLLSRRGGWWIRLAQRADGIIGSYNLVDRAGGSPAQQRLTDVPDIGKSAMFAEYEPVCWV